MMVENLLHNENTKIVEKLRRIEFGKFALAEIIDIRQNCIVSTHTTLILLQIGTLEVRSIQDKWKKVCLESRYTFPVKQGCDKPVMMITGDLIGSECVLGRIRKKLDFNYER